MDGLSPATAANFTAVGYFFARDLNQSLHVPVGIIRSSWGGTEIKVWTSHDAMQKWEQSLDTNDAQVIDLHSPTNDYLAKRRETEPHFSFTGDGIHPNEAGHLLIAEIVLKGLGYSISFEDNLHKELAKVQAIPSTHWLKSSGKLVRTAGWPMWDMIGEGKVKADSVTDAERAYTDLQDQIDKARVAQKN